VELAKFHVQISKKQTRLLYVIVTKVAVCAIDTAWLVVSLLGDGKCWRK
jgi:hypothetical protein